MAKRSKDPRAKGRILDRPGLERRSCGITLFGLSALLLALGVYEAMLSASPHRYTLLLATGICWLGCLWAWRTVARSSTSHNTQRAVMAIVMAALVVLLAFGAWHGQASYWYGLLVIPLASTILATAPALSGLATTLALAIWAYVSVCGPYGLEPRLAALVAGSAALASWSAILWQRRLFGQIDVLSDIAVSAERLEAEAQRSLLCARREFAALLDGVTEAVLFCNQRVITKANPAAATLFGRTPDAMVGARLSELLAPDSLHRLGGNLLVGKHESLELTGMRADSSILILRAASFPLEPDGAATSHLLILENLTGAKRTQQAIRAANEEGFRLARAMAATSDGIAMLDPHREGMPVVYANPAFARITGYTTEALAGRGLDILNDHQSDADSVAAIGESLSKGEPVELVIRHRRRDGTHFWDELKASPVRDAKGQLLYHVCIVTDVTDRIETRQRIERQLGFEQLIATISTRFVNRSLDMVDHTVEQALRAVGLFLGARHGYLAMLDDGNQTLTAHHAWAVPGQLSALRRVIGLPRVDELPTELHRGETCVLERGTIGFDTLAEEQDRTVAVAPVMRSEALRGILVFGSDGAAPPWDSESDALLRLVAEVLSAGLERRRLVISLAKARDEALESSRLKSEFLATMGHEIRTPIHGIIGMSEMLMDTLPQEETRSWAQSILEEGTRLMEMMGAILDYAQLEAGRLVLASAPYDPQELLQDLVDQMTQKAASKALYVDLEIDPGMPQRLVGDAPRMAEAVREVLDNAIKFTNQGGVTVRAQYEKQMHGRPALTIVVSDTGIGIPDEMQEAIFGAFRQADGSTTRKHGGTGLGLALARGLVEAMGGSIELDSNPKRGASFRLRIPAPSAKRTR